MATDRPREHQGDDGYPPPQDNDPDCDPSLIDEVACKAVGVAAQALYNATYQAQLDKAKSDYDTARKSYRDQRYAANRHVQEMRHQIKHLIEKLKCHIEQRRVWRCLDKAYDKTIGELDACEPPHARCCVDSCEFDIDDVDCLSWAELLKRIDSYQHQTDKAQKCFNDLVAEPAALAQRVADAKAAIDAIDAALNADPIPNLKVLYAKALVANRDVQRIWGGFTEAHEFVDCLCKALTCWTKGCAAVSVLTCARAVAECKRKAYAAHCAHLKTNTVDEIMAVYDKLCPQYGVCEEDGEHASDDDDDHDDEDDEYEPRPHRHHERDQSST